MAVSFELQGYNNRVHTDKINNVEVEGEFQTWRNWKTKKGSETETGYNTESSIGNTVISTWETSDIQSRCSYGILGDKGTVTVKFRRKNPTSGVYAPADANNGYTKTLTVYWKPENKITTATFKRNNSNESTVTGGQVLINDSSLTGIYVSWNYTTTDAKAGYTQGYRVRVYKQDGTTTTYDTTTSNKYITIPKANIPTGQPTKISITPYYKAGQENKNNFRYAPESKMDFVKIIAQLATPTITYPINNSTWINKQIRIAFQLPYDADSSVQGNNYRYEDIELMLDNTYTIHYKPNTAGRTTGGTNVQTTACFSTTVLTHQKKIVIQPSLASNTAPLSDGVHKVKVRVKKQYNTSSTFNGWSQWSPEVIFKIQTYNYSVNVGDKILAQHYNTIHDYVTNISNTYGVTPPPIDIRVKPNETLIRQAEYNYSKMAQKIQQVMIVIRDYCSYDSDKTALKFNSGNDIVTAFPTYKEYVTATKTKSGWTTANPNGRNYMTYIFDYGAQLK